METVTITTYWQRSPRSVVGKDGLRDTMYENHNQVKENKVNAECYDEVLTNTLKWAKVRSVKRPDIIEGVECHERQEYYKFQDGVAV